VRESRRSSTASQVGLLLLLQLLLLLKLPPSTHKLLLPNVRIAVPHRCMLELVTIGCCAAACRRSRDHGTGRPGCLVVRQNAEGLNQEPMLLNLQICTAHKLHMACVRHIPEHNSQILGCKPAQLFSKTAAGVQATGSPGGCRLELVHGRTAHSLCEAQVAGAVCAQCNPPRP